jgi:hypothetical protein
MAIKSSILSGGEQLRDYMPVEEGRILFRKLIENPNV